MESMSVLWLPLVAALVWMGIVRSLDTHRRLKNSARLVPAFFVAGLLSIPLSGLFYGIVAAAGVFLWPVAQGVFFEHVFIVGPVEESAKFLVFLAMVNLVGAVKEPKDGIIQGATVAMGFAVLENMGYGIDYGFGTHVWRSVFTVPGHMVYGALWGYAYGRARERAAVQRVPADYAPVYAALGWTAVLHGIYNYLAVTGLPDLAMLTDFVAIALVLTLLSQLTRSSPFYAYPLQQYRAAIPAIQRGLRLDPTSVVLYRRLGLYHLYAGHFDTAVRAFDRYLQSRPRSLYVQIYRGVAIFLQGHEERARPIIRKAAARLRESERAAVKRHVARLVRDSAARRELAALVVARQVAGGAGSRRIADGTRVLLDERARRRTATGVYSTESSRRAPSAIRSGS